MEQQANCAEMEGKVARDRRWLDSVMSGKRRQPGPRAIREGTVMAAATTP
jgi:hypothetical protein